MFTKMATTTGLSTSMRSVKNLTVKTQATPSRPGASPTKYGQAEVLSRPSSSQLADAYKTEEFVNEWTNDVQFHVARNVLNLRRYRRMSQASVAIGTSQSAIARIESGQENITMDTLRRIVVALKGRLQVSIPPQECARHQVRPWWEANGPAVNTWNLVGWAAREGHQKDQLILGLERPCERGLSGSTLPLKAGIFLEPASTGVGI